MLTFTVSEARRANPVSVLPAAALLAVTALSWYALNQQAPRGPLVLGWVCPPLALALAAFSLASVGTSAALQPSARRFWCQIAGVAAVAAVGVVVQGAYAVVGQGPAAHIPPSAALLYIGAVLYTVWAVSRLPMVSRSPGERARILLDSATVVLGAGIFMWYVAFSPLLERGGVGVIWVPMVVGVICLAGISAVVNIMLAGAGRVDMVALRLLGGALLVGGISAGTATLIAARPHLVPAQISVPLLCVFAVLAAERQRRAAAAEAPPGPSRRRRGISLLPYGAVAATDGLLVLATIGRVDDRTYVVVIGAITITALVAVRQVVAFTDNARLVERLQQQEDRLRHQASHDALTQLANRALFAERLEAALRAGNDLTVLLIDLDDFKSVNDTLGHTVGDRLLAAVAGPIRRCVRPEDTVARLGGDEFAVLLQHAQPSTVDGVAEGVLAALSQPVTIDGCELLVQASIGIACAAPGDDAEALLRNADIAMYAAKERGKGRYARYVPGMAARILHHAQLGAQLRQGIDDGELCLFYQPIVRLADRRIIGMEALARWRRPGRDLVSPLEFIPTAERTGLIVPLGRWVLGEACRQKAAWRNTYGDLSPATIGVNVSGRQLQERTFVDEVAQAVREADMEPHHLVLEVTETAVLSGGQVLDTLHGLRDLGVILALDDFGTGQSSLGLIRTCPVHILKLDKSFVTDGRGTWHAEQQTAIATAVVHIADALGLDAVAEGIESQAQADRLCALGYRLGQGFHLGRPSPPAEVEVLLAMNALSL